MSNIDTCKLLVFYLESEDSKTEKFAGFQAAIRSMCQYFFSLLTCPYLLISPSLPSFLIISLKPSCITMMRRVAHDVNRYDTCNTRTVRQLRAVRVRHQHDICTTTAWLARVDCGVQRRDDVVVAGSQGLCGTLAVPRRREPASFSEYHRG